MVNRLGFVSSGILLSRSSILSSTDSDVLQKGKLSNGFEQAGVSGFGSDLDPEARARCASKAIDDRESIPVAIVSIQ